MDRSRVELPESPSITYALDAYAAAKCRRAPDSYRLDVNFPDSDLQRIKLLSRYPILLDGRTL